MRTQIEGLTQKHTTGFFIFDRAGRVLDGNGWAGKIEIAYITSFVHTGSATSSIVVNGDKYVLHQSDLPVIGGKVVSVVNQRKLFAELNQIYRWSLFILMFISFLLFISFMIVTNNIVHPLTKLMNFMKNLKSGNLKYLKKDLSLVGHAEISILSKEFSGMLNEIDLLTHRLLETNTRLYEIELMKKQSELAFLRSQINPHFLYNTLETISSISNLRGVTEIQQISKALASIFRYSVKGAEFERFEKELEIIKGYIRIHQIRFEDKFDVIYDIEESILDCIFPKMLLQPIVENAFYHGIEKSLKRCLLIISGSKDYLGRLLISVKDTGIGIPDKKLSEIKTMLEANTGIKHENSAIGLINVNSRIVMIYGKQYGITIDRVLPQGTEVKLTIPYRRADSV